MSKQTEPTTVDEKASSPVAEPVSEPAEKLEEDKKVEEQQEAEQENEVETRPEDSTAKETKVEEDVEAKESKLEPAVEVKPTEGQSEAPPPKPKRPLSPKQEAEKHLQEAFPSIEFKYVKAVLIASNYRPEYAFNALLFLSDPSSFSPEEVVEVDAPPLPQRRQLTQIEQDELLAKKLDEEYNHKKHHRGERAREHQHGSRKTSKDHSRSSANDRLYDDDDDDDIISTFVDKELPVLKEQFNENLEFAKSKFNSWVSGWKQQYQQSNEELTPNRRPKKSLDLYQFDNDEPEEVDLQKFHGISLGSDDADNEASKPKLPSRNRAGSTDIYGTPKKTTSNKWEPLSSSKPEPIKMEDDDDDFLVSDDEIKK